MSLPCCVHRTVSAQEETTSAAEVLELLHHADSCNLDQLPPEGPTFTGVRISDSPMHAEVGLQEYVVQLNLAHCDGVSIRRWMSS